MNAPSPNPRRVIDAVRASDRIAAQLAACNRRPSAELAASVRAWRACLAACTDAQLPRVLAQLADPLPPRKGPRSP